MGRPSGRQRGWGPIIAFLIVVLGGAAAGIHYTAPVSGLYRATISDDGAPPKEITLDGDREWVERGGIVYLRVEHRRDYPVLGRMSSADTWHRARVALLRGEHPRLADLDCWPDPAAPHGGVAWVSETP